jgi:regulator of protease activity HflC (stomatin/prohibitin superfamily)
MQALVDFIVRNLMALWPVALVKEWEIAVMMRNGRIHRSLGTGLHWRWLFIEECKTWPSQEIVIDLPVGSCTTADGHTLTVSANLGYKVADYTTYLRSVWNGEASIKATAIGFLTSTVAGKDWQVMATDRKGFERELCASLGHVVAPWGVEVTRVYLTDLVEAKQYRLFGDPRAVV